MERLWPLPLARGAVLLLARGCGRAATAAVVWGDQRHRYALHPQARCGTILTLSYRLMFLDFSSNISLCGFYL